jgi:hypothetical protein
MPVLLFPSGRDRHRFATANIISSRFFPRSRYGSAPGVHRCLSHLLSSSAEAWKRQGEVSGGSRYAIGRRVKLRR